MIRCVRRLPLLVLVLLATVLPAASQSITDYSLVPGSETFTYLDTLSAVRPVRAGGTADDGWYNDIPIGFTFNFNGTDYTELAASTNGWLGFGQDSLASGGTGTGNNLRSGQRTAGPSSTNARPLLAPFWDDLEVGTTGYLAYQTTGSPGTQVFTLEWKDMYWNYTATSPALSFQVKLYESNGRIEFRYQQESGATAGSLTASIGFAAADTGAGNFLSLDGTGSSPGVSSTSETTGLSVRPASGQVYGWTRSPMSYNSSTTVQNTANVTTGAVDAWIIDVQVVMDGALSPLDLTQLNLSTTGTTSTADILNAKVYWTGTSGTFAPVNQFGSTVVSPSGAFTVTGARTLAGGTNHFWVVYDVAPGATPNNLLDAQCTQITVNGIARTPTITAPIGGRQIRSALSGVYTIDAGGSGSNNYTTFTAAVADLNALGVSGAVTFNVAAGQTFSGPILITATGTLANPVVFQKSGAGADPVIEAPGTASTTDAIVTLSGSDYIRFDGIDLRPTAGSTAMEWGYYLVGGAADGCKNNTIRNCTVTMNRSNTNSRGVYVSSFATTAAGANTENVFYNNTILDAYVGYWFGGSSTAADDGNEIGTTGPGTSLVRRIGGGSLGAYGVYYAYQTNFRVANTVVDSVSGTSTVGGIYTGLGTMNTAEITGNTLTNLSGATSSAYGIYASSGSSFLVEGNDIRNVSTTAAAVYGVYISASGSAVTVRKNDISAVVYAGTSTSGAFGIYTAGGMDWLIANNMIYDIRAAGSTGTTTPTAGIFVSSGTTITCVYNTVLLDYVSTTASNVSSAIWVSSTPTSVDLRNNIFVNRTDVTTGTRAAAFRKSTTSLTNIAAATNTNLYYAGTPSAKNLIFHDGTNSDQLLADYKARMATRDQAAVTENPPFVSASAPYDLHMSTGTPTQTESGGTPVTSPVAVTDDVDGNTRNASTPDIGADEFAGIAQDVTAPVVVYTPPGNSIVTPTRTLAATVTDGVAGVQRSVAGRPRIYYKKGAAGLYSPGSGTEGPTDTWTFTINHTTIGATGVGDTVFYYVAAQDSAGNAGTSPAGTSPTIDPPNATVAAPNFYRIAASFAGSVTIGSAGPELATFPTVKAFFDSVNASVVTGAVSATITTNVLESAPAVLTPVAYGAGGPFTITISPAPATVDTVSGAFTGPVIQLLGADNVVIDGSNSGGTDRSLTILNTGTTAASAAVALSSAGAGQGASGNTLKNLNLACGAAQSTGTTETFGIFSGGTTIGVSSEGSGNNGNTFLNNAVLKVRWGIWVRGGAVEPNTGTVISDNVVGPDSFGVLQIGKGGITLLHQSGPVITGNTVKFVGGPYGLTTSGTDRVGIGVGAGEGWPLASATGIANAVVTGNVVHDVVDERTFSAVGIGVAASGTGTNNLVANNMVYDLRANGTAGDMTVGICLAAGNGDRVVFNAVRLGGDLDPAGGPSTSSVSSTGIRITGTGVVNLTLRNNIASVDFTSNTATLKHYAVIAPASHAWGTGGADNNLYHATPGNPQMVLGGIGTAMTYTDVPTLAAWRTQFTPNQELASVTGDPLFVSATDLHITSGASPASNAGAPVAGVATDFDGEARNPGTPDIGADEFSSTTTLVNVSLAAGWNMISKPVTTAADSVRQLYPNAQFAYAFSFSGSGGYQQRFRMENGVGYWEKFNAPEVNGITGFPRPSDSVTVVAGWNMVGTVSGPVDTSTITSSPAGIRSSQWFGFSGGYAPAAVLTPGAAYWVKASAAGKFWFASGPVPQVATGDRAAGLAALNSITVADAAGNSQTLWFGVAAAGAVRAADYVMPPPPPSGVMDVRFADGGEGRLVQVLSGPAGEFPIDVRNAAAPVTVSWNIAQAGDAAYTLSDGAGGTRALAGEGSLRIDRSGVARLVLRAAGGAGIPAEFALLQNYPNPFNPSTTIAFGLPVAARVTVEIFNLLGQKVATLAGRSELKAGWHSLTWNGVAADGLPVGSGVYFIRYAADGGAGATFTDMRKMMLMK
jgi:hypothetical protein